MLQWIKRARSWHVLVRVGLATIVVAATTVLQLPVEVNFPGQPFLLYFVAVVSSASVLGRTAGFVAVAETSIASLLFYDPAYSLKVTQTVDLLAVEIYAVVAALSVEAFCRLVDGAISAEARLADHEVELKITRNSEARLGPRSTRRRLEWHTSLPTADGSGSTDPSAALSATRPMNSLPSRSRTLPIRTISRPILSRSSLCARERSTAITSRNATCARMARSSGPGTLSAACRANCWRAIGVPGAALSGGDALAATATAMPSSDIPPKKCRIEARDDHVFTDCLWDAYNFFIERREADRQQNLAGASLPRLMLILRKRAACRWPRRTPHPALRPLTISMGNKEFNTTTNG